MDSDAGTCAVCGTETDYHQQEINGSTLTRCRRHSPRRSNYDRATEPIIMAALVVGAPLLALSHLWFGAGTWSSSAATFGRVVETHGYDTSHLVVQAHLEFFRWSDALFGSLMTVLSVAILAVYAVGAVMALSDRFEAKRTGGE